jgi:hypothetical protein
MVAVHGASGPWGRPRGPMEMCVVRCIAVTPHVTETLIKVINKKLGANMILNQKAEFKK